MDAAALPPALPQPCSGAPWGLTKVATCRYLSMGRAGFEPATLGLKSVSTKCRQLQETENACKPRDSSVQRTVAKRTLRDKPVPPPFPHRVWPYPPGVALYTREEVATIRGASSAGPS